MDRQFEYFNPSLNKVEKTLLRLGEISSLIAATTIRYAERKDQITLPISYRSYHNKDGELKTVGTINSREFLIYRFRVYEETLKKYKSFDFYFTALQVYSLRNAIRKCLNWLDDDSLFAFRHEKWYKHHDVDSCFVKVTAINEKVISVYPDIKNINDMENERVVYFQASNSIYDSICYEDAYNLYEYLANINLSQIAMNMLALMKFGEEKEINDVLEKGNEGNGINLFILDAIISVMNEEKFKELEELSELDLSVFLKKGKTFKENMESFKKWLLNTGEDGYAEDRQTLYRILTKA